MPSSAMRIIVLVVVEGWAEPLRDPTRFNLVSIKRRASGGSRR
jgi:hypothetical protein